MERTERNLVGLFTALVSMVAATMVYVKKRRIVARERAFFVKRAKK
jgi:hypothetical protein